MWTHGRAVVHHVLLLSYLGCPQKNIYWGSPWIKITYVDTWESCSAACGSDSRCYKWNWYPATYTYAPSFGRRCVFKPDNGVPTPLNHGVFSGLKNCHLGLF